MTSASGGGRLLLRPRARLVRTLGDELISSESVAVMELVKNAYDADATDVLLRFLEPLTRSEGCIELMDNGHGMSPETLRTAFLEPATPFRRKEKRTRYRNRRVLGEKGIGRFAVSGLADHLCVITREAGAAFENSLALSWTDFDDDSKFLDEIEIRWKESPPTNFRCGGAFDRLHEVIGGSRHENGYRGTILRMQGLRHNWTETDFNTLRNNLSRMVSPFASKVQETFRIHIEIPGKLSLLSGTVSTPDFLAHPHYRVSGRMEENGAYKLDASLRGRTERDPITGTARSRTGNCPTCGPFEIELRVWDRDRDSLAPLVERSGGTLRSFRQELDGFAGISIYRDGFRVLPYGEPRNDWLRLDLRRVQAPTRALSNNQIVGYISISADDNPELKDQSNREGLLQNAALDDLEHAALTILSEIETRRFIQRQDDRKDRAARRGIFEGLDLDDLQRGVRRHAPSDKQLHNMVAQSARTIQTRLSEIKAVLARYHRLATLGQLVDTILHEGRAPLSKIRTDVALALRAPASRAETAVRHRDTRKRLGAIETQAAVLARLFKKIEPFGGRQRGRPRPILIEDVARDAVALLEAEIARDDVEVRISPTRTEVTVDPVELQSVIYNLAANSMYWLKTLPSGCERTIEIEVRRIASSEVEILVSDNGPGVDPEFSDRIFEPYFSTKPHGVGLGLTHAGEIVTDYYDGQLELLNPGNLRGATFRVTLKRRV